MRLGILAVAMLLAACKTAPPLELGHGRYSLTGHAQFGCPGAAREDAVGEAREFCQTKGQRVSVQNFEDFLGQGAMYCSSSVVFMCD